MYATHTHTTVGAEGVLARSSEGGERINRFPSFCLVLLQSLSLDCANMLVFETFLPLIDLVCACLAEFASSQGSTTPRSDSLLVAWTGESQSLVRTFLGFTLASQYVDPVPLHLHL